MTNEQKVKAYLKYQESRSIESCGCEQCKETAKEMFLSWCDGYSTGHDVATADSTKDQDLKIADTFHEGEVEGRKG